MNDVEARVRCLELAAALHKPSGDYSPANVVKTAQTLYDFAINAQPAPEKVPVADKSSKGKKPTQADILS